MTGLKSLLKWCFFKAPLQGVMRHAELSGYFRDRMERRGQLATLLKGNGNSGLNLPINLFSSAFINTHLTHLQAIPNQWAEQHNGENKEGNYVPRVRN